MPTPTTTGEHHKRNPGQHTPTLDSHHHPPHQTKQTRTDQSRKSPKTPYPQRRDTGHPDHETRPSHRKPSKYTQQFATRGHPFPHLVNVCTPPQTLEETGLQTVTRTKENTRHIDKLKMSLNNLHLYVDNQYIVYNN
ncbi:Hypothetical predicted protein [Pelobates cultripes]|uniref:Uncharacterized protein n=1 Tax=Pelobates cultripes TaxID=61616 RepID=A0AAD1T7N4_PELCU|nr:Hypothetical predicted protein [Pelobates cultripes]